MRCWWALGLALALCSLGCGASNAPHAAPADAGTSAVGTGEYRVLGTTVGDYNLSGLAGTGGDSIVEAADGTLYGLVNSTVLRLDRGGTLRTLFTFPSDATLQQATGSSPASLVLHADGNLYGAAHGGGSIFTRGALFELSPAGEHELVYYFGSDDASASGSPTSLLTAADGALYGTAAKWLVNGGELFKLDPTGAVTILHAFDADEVREPWHLVEAADGAFYGVARRGGSDDGGAFFKLAPGGDVSVLGSFPAGLNPHALVASRDGNFYGISAYGGSNELGAFFKLTPTGDFTLLAEPDADSDVRSPLTLLEATDGNFYGVSVHAIFRLTPDGEATVVQEVPDAVPSSLTQGRDGRLLGTWYRVSATLAMEMGVFEVE